MKFELNRLPGNNNENLLAELQRVAALIDNPVVTTRAFNEHSKVHSDTIKKRFGGWKAALLLAGLGDRYSGRTVSPKMLHQLARKYTDDNMISELQNVAKKLGTSTFTMEMFNKHSAISAGSISRRLGWQIAMEGAGLTISNHGKRHSDDDYFENLLVLCNRNSFTTRWVGNSTIPLN